jgi:selenocysteine lyase/cysteine desulfurase
MERILPHGSTAGATIECQRHLFDLPDDAAYFRCASSSPLLKRGCVDGQEGVARKLRPWTIGAADTVEAMERVRALLAGLTESSADDWALAPSAAYGASSAAAVLPLARGQEVVLVAEEFPALVYPLTEKARAAGATITTVARPADGDWTQSVLAAINARTGIVGLCQANWLDGAMLDLELVASACRRVGAALLLDLSQSLGAVPLSLRRIDPDFVVAVAEKWLFGPCRLSYLYVAPRWHGARPLETGWASRAHGLDMTKLTSYAEAYAPGARRFDVDEHSDYVALPQAILGLEQVAAWGVARIAASLRPITGEIAARAQALGFVAPAAAVRAPHLLGLRAQSGAITPALATALEARGVYVAVRNGVLRIGPHLYNNARDLDALFAALAEVWRAERRA